MTQIVVLDAIFSLDSVITAVGMVDHLLVMMAAVVIAISLMLMASKPLTQFVNSHPTIVILCLSFLLMIGFSTVAERFRLRHSERLPVRCHWFLGDDRGAQSVGYL